MTDLEKAFEECGEQLDRIADALKREKPVQNYPRTLRFTPPPEIATIEVTINEDLTYSSDYSYGFVIEDSVYTPNAIQVIIQNTQGCGTEYDKDTFEFITGNFNPMYTPSWV